MRSSLCLSSLLLFALAGCDAGRDAPVARPQHATARTASQPAHIATGLPSDANELDALAGLQCTGTPNGKDRTCSTRGYAVSGSYSICTGDSASFGAIQPGDPVTANDRLLSGQPIASLAAGQFVCIQFNAQPTGAGEPWVYVTAIDPAQVSRCATALCGDASARSTWTSPRPTNCRVEGDRYGSGCPAGWIPSSRVDAYSMGL